MPKCKEACLRWPVRCKGCNKSICSLEDCEQASLPAAGEASYMCESCHQDHLDQVGEECVVCGDELCSCGDAIEWGDASSDCAACGGKLPWSEEVPYACARCHGRYHSSQKARPDMADAEDALKQVKYQLVLWRGETLNDALIARILSDSGADEFIEEGS